MQRIIEAQSILPSENRNKLVLLNNVYIYRFMYMYLQFVDMVNCMGNCVVILQETITSCDGEEPHGTESESRSHLY